MQKPAVQSRHIISLDLTHETWRDVQRCFFLLLMVFQYFPTKIPTYLQLFKPTLLGAFAPPKTNMEPKNWWFVYVFPFQAGICSGSMLVFGDVLYTRAIDLEVPNSHFQPHFSTGTKVSTQMAENLAQWKALWVEDTHPSDEEPVEQ